MPPPRGSQERISNVNNTTNEEFVRNLESLTGTVRDLLFDIRQGEVNFATVKTQLQTLFENRKHADDRMKEMEITIIEQKTKIALMEKNFSQMEKWQEEKNKEDAALKATDKAGKWQIYSGIVTGVFGLVIAIVSLLVNFAK